MALPFTREEYISRVAKVRSRMNEKGIDLLLVADAANIYWLTGVEDWSFYVPQLALVSATSDEPLWIGRASDAPGARLTAWMSQQQIYSYPETYIQRRGIHASDYIGEFIAARGFSDAIIGYESDSYNFSPKSFAHLKRALPNATFADCDLLVNWARLVKSAAELDYMRDAASIVEGAMRIAYDAIQPGARQCDAVAEIYKAQIAPNDRFAGDVTSLCPIILAGEMAATAHPIWSEKPFLKDQTVAIELGGARRRYTCGLARTMHLGHNPPKQVVDTAKAVEEGLLAVLDVLKAGVTGAQTHAAWQSVLDRYSLKKDSRIGYSIGIGFPPDWGEHTISLRAGDNDPIETDTTVHIMLGMWMEGWGMEMSETVRVVPSGVECLTNFPRALHTRT